MGMMSEIAIAIEEYFENNQDALAVLEALSAEDFCKHPLAIEIAKSLDISVELFSGSFDRDIAE